MLSVALRRFLRLILPCFCLALSLRASHHLPDEVAPAIADRQLSPMPDAVRLTGWLGLRVDGNATKRLSVVDTDRLLESYRKRPGLQTWDGEHIGKWLHAATLAWAATGDPALRAKLDHVAAELAKCQLEDGYLGTYLPEDYWKNWDVWAHKYNLIGLITYARFTGEKDALVVCRRMADLLCRTFGDTAGRRDLARSSGHFGMPSLSVLEPMAQLYRLTGEPRYLEFCRYILRASEQEHGPKIISTLLTLKRVNKVGNGKAYELLSCLNGMLEMYRTTGDTSLLDACLNAWEDIVAKRIYITGATSYVELFRDDFDLPNAHKTGETCATVTWVQFNAQLLRLTDEARFAEELERVVLNQLLGAQSPDCTGWGYYVQMQGKKPYTSELTGQCCLSSGPRGVALIPTFSMGVDAEGAVINLYDAGNARLPLPGGKEVRLTIETKYPSDGRIHIVVTPGAPLRFGVKLRIPAWTPDASIAVNGVRQTVATGPGGYVSLQRTWEPGDVIELVLKMEPRLQLGEHANAGKAAILYGPLVLAADEALVPDDVRQLALLSLHGADVQSLGFVAEPAPGRVKTWPEALVFKINAGLRRTSEDRQAVIPREIRLIPFADAGGSGSRYQVWLPLGGSTGANVLLEGTGRMTGKPTAPKEALPFHDDDFVSASVLWTHVREEQTFEVLLDRPADIRRVAFTHGLVLTNGGWFDASEGKPRVQIRREREGVWETVGELTEYPATTAEDGGVLGKDKGWVMSPAATAAAAKKDSDARTFEVILPSSERVFAVRVAGMPSRMRTSASADSCGVICAELKAFRE